MSVDDSGPVQTHLPCDDCGSSDALSQYSDGHTHCFSCGKTRQGSSLSTEQEASKPKAKGSILPGKAYALKARGLTEETCKIWSYHKVDHNGKTVQCANFFNDKKECVAQKLRYPDKSFPWRGNRKDFKGLYGQWLWRDGGRRVVITEGEIDALSVSQLQQNKWPVVSLVDGAGSAEKGIKEAISWLEAFDEVVLLFDNDEAGREAEAKARVLFSPGKCKIARLPEDLKDPSEALVANRGREVISAIWEAKGYKPDGLLSGSDILERLHERPEITSYPYPDSMPEMNNKTYGIRLGDLDVWTSGTGMGKTTLIKMLQHHFFHTTSFNQALMHLEEPVEDTAESLVSYETGKRLNLPDVRAEMDEEKYWETASALFDAKDAEGKHRLQLYDGFGSVGDTRLFELIRHFAIAEGCQIIWLDHLSILVSDTDENEDERRRIDRIMHKLKALTVELNIYIGLISHLKKAPQGRSFEEGYVPSLDDLRGSGSIKQLSNGVYALSRNQQASNEMARNTSTITVLKCRYTGRTGTADHLLFGQTTGHLEASIDPDEITDDGFEDTSGSQDY